MDHLALLRNEVAAMAAALRAADPLRDVPSCPGWTVAELTAHVTGVHRWALGALRNEGLPAYDETPATAEDYAEAAGALVDGLARLPRNAPCWTFDRDNPTAGFWRRRQLHEVTIHRWDVERHELDPLVAADGVNEVIDFFLPRQVRAGRTTLPPGTLTLDTGHRTRTIGSGGGKVTVHGSPADLDLLLWGRRGLDTLEIDGSVDVARAILTSGLTP